MRRRTNRKLGVIVASLSVALVLASSTARAQGESDALKDALRAAWPGMAENATVVDWEGNVLREGSNGYTCLPTPPMLAGTAPMCMDSEWMKWADAWQNKKGRTRRNMRLSRSVFPTCWPATREQATSILTQRVRPTTTNGSERADT